MKNLSPKSLVKELSRLDFKYNADLTCLSMNPTYLREIKENNMLVERHILSVSKKDSSGSEEDRYVLALSYNNQNNPNLPHNTTIYLGSCTIKELRPVLAERIPSLNYSPAFG